MLSTLPVGRCARAECYIKRGSLPAVVCCPLYAGLPEAVY